MEFFVEYFGIITDQINSFFISEIFVKNFLIFFLCPLFFSMIFLETGVRMQGFKNNCCLVLLPVDDGDEEMHVLFIETRDDGMRLEHFGEEEFWRFFGGEDEEMRSYVFINGRGLGKL